MRRSGLLVWQILQKMREMAVEGVSTMDLEVTAEKMMADAGAKPAFKGYYVPAAGEEFKFVLCTSVNEEIVHGMPNVKRILKKGDIVSIDPQLHEEPQVPNYVDSKNEKPRLKAGMVFAVEPMVNSGKANAIMLNDK